MEGGKHSLLVLHWQVILCEVINYPQGNKDEEIGWMKEPIQEYRYNRSLQEHGDDVKRLKYGGKSNTIITAKVINPAYIPAICILACPVDCAAPCCPVAPGTCC